MNWIEPGFYEQIRKVMPRPTADFIAVRDGRILLLKRQIPPCVGYWCVPGGGIRIGETPENTARRKLREETGLEGGRVAEAGTATFLLGDRQDVSITFIGEVTSDEVRLDYQHSEYVWAKINELPEPMLEVTVNQIKQAVGLWKDTEMKSSKR